MRFGGDISRYGLDGWWLKAFTDEEREIIADAYQPLGAEGRPLLEGNSQHQPELHPGPFLANLATWVSKPTLSDQALRIADKASSFDVLPSDLWQAHFMFANLCKVYYRLRETHPGTLEKAVWACERAIALSPKLGRLDEQGSTVLAHYCFKQLSIIEEKRGNFDRALHLCMQAASEGWGGDWQKRITRLKKRKEKAQK